jgi:hypothetical protein
MIISRSKKFAYIHLEKCGGTSIEFALEKHIRWDDLVMGSTNIGADLSILYNRHYGFRWMKKNAIWKHSNVHDLRRNLEEEYENYYVFATVRDPLEIMKSFYFYAKKIGEQYIKENNVIDIEDFVYGNEFPYTWINDDPYMLDYFESQVDNKKFNGFTERMISKKRDCVLPQMERLDSSVDIYDLSTIEETWPIVLDKLKITDPCPLTIKNKSDRDEKFRISKSSKDMIRDHFAIDYKEIPQYTGVAWQ